MSSGVFSSKQGITLFVAMALAEGVMCPRCGYGTRRTSKRWARCKKCGHRVERRTLGQPRVEG